MTDGIASPSDLDSKDPPDPSPSKRQVPLYYFDEVIAVEHEAINRRRLNGKRGERRSPRVRLFSEMVDSPLSMDEDPNDPQVVAQRGQAPNHARTRPLPTTCDANGLALSGGGVRSAAFCLGALQALEAHSALQDIDYLSTVSGGGYVGASLAAAMSRNGGQFPFATGRADIRDSDSVGHLRNFSNYLMPRGRSFLANVGDVFAVLARGVLANSLVVLPYMLMAALATAAAVPKLVPLGQESFFTRLLSHVPILSGNDGLIALLIVAGIAFTTTLARRRRGTLSTATRIITLILGFVVLACALLLSPIELSESRGPFSLSLWLAGALAFSLVLWALWRSRLLVHQDVLVAGA